ncbi:MAG: outer membrane protein assembly factor BamA [Rhodobacterales bacterium]|nr:outer membrane protein assembly factor BamA [Rhodobacterales bacterium]NCT12512.1 outer membrane protein assembly factor BamA [Rhodobacterales bacterium]
MNRLSSRVLSRLSGHARGLVGGMVVALCLIAGSAGIAQAQQFRFTDVRVEGNQRIETGTILTFAGITRGEALSGADINDAIQRIRASGLFESVDATPQGGLLVISVVEFPTINRISIEGNARLSDTDLGAVLGSQERRVYSPAQAERDVAAMAELYAQRGRINATINPAIIRRSDNRVDLVFEVFEGGVTEVERISFVGNRSFSERRLRGVLETKQAGLLRAVISRDTFVADRIALDRQVLTDFYRSRGYVDFTVQNVDVALTRERDAYLITFNVQEGQVFRFGRVTVTSEIPEADPAAFEAALRLRPGATYSPTLIDTDIARLERLALRQGINFLTVEPRITRNDRDLTLDIDFALVRGDRIFVERIDIEGNNTTLDRVVRSQFRVVEGDPFNPRAIRESAERIRALGFFANADVQARQGSAPDQVVIDVNLEEAPTGSLSFGANFNSDNGFSVFAAYKERNFLGRGQSLDFQISTGASNRIFSLNFGEPQFLGRDLRFGLDLSYRTTNNDNAVYDTETFRFSPSFTFPVSENARLTTYYSFDYTDITDVDPDASVVIRNEADLGGVATNSVGYTYSFDTRRTGLDPNSGIVLRFGQEFGVGEASFVRTTALAAAETKVWGEEVTLRATIEGGLLAYGNGQSRVTDRFFLGSRIMRGFEPGGIGPRDAETDDALGGNAYAVARLESEFPLGLPEEYGITGGAFIDYGSVWDVGQTYGANVLYDAFTPRAVVGLSVFWTTPVGPLRFNFTEPLMAEEFDRPRSFEVTISTSF